MSLKVTSLDHLVLTVSSIEETVAFYQAALGMKSEQFKATDGGVRWALYFGDQKINLHEAGNEFLPNAKVATAGSADLCFLTDTSVADWLPHLEAQSIYVEEGPVTRSGATGPILSIYLRDPDGNLIEVSEKL